VLSLSTPSGARWAREAACFRTSGLEELRLHYHEGAARCGGFVSGWIQYCGQEGTHACSQVFSGFKKSLQWLNRPVPNVQIPPETLKLACVCEHTARAQACAGVGEVVMCKIGERWTMKLNNLSDEVDASHPPMTTLECDAQGFLLCLCSLVVF
jgi:hypothetical protein